MMTINEFCKQMEITEVVSKIVNLNGELKSFWSNSDGWAPEHAAQSLSKSRLDRQVSLSHTLKIWIKPEENKKFRDGKLILAWANLGSLLEGSLKLFLSIYYEDYIKDDDCICKKGKAKDPDSISLEQLRQFFVKKIWHTRSPEEKIFNKIIEKIQKKRNSIHAFQDKDIGSYEEVMDCIRDYLSILIAIIRQLPYPDEYYFAAFESFNKAYHSTGQFSLTS